MTHARTLRNPAIGLAAGLAATTAVRADGPCATTDLQIAGFEAVSLPSRVGRGRVAEAGELNFLLRHGHRGARCVCTMALNPRDGKLFDDRCLRPRPGESPSARPGLSEGG